MVKRTFNDSQARELLTRLLIAAEDRGFRWTDSSETPSGEDFKLVEGQYFEAAPRNLKYVIGSLHSDSSDPFILTVSKFGGFGDDEPVASMVSSSDVFANETTELFGKLWRLARSRATSGEEIFEEIMNDLSLFEEPF